MSTLETKDITKRFDGVQALHRLSVSVERGTITSIVGPNGSGKTTLFNLISGMLPFDEGWVVLEGIALKKIKPYNIPLYGVTRTFQEVRVFEQMTVLDNILVVITERNLWGAFFERHTSFHLMKAEEALRKVGLWEKRDAKAEECSYGQRKLLEIARALAMNTNILLFDEPFAGLFPEAVTAVANTLKELRTQGKTIVLVEHNMELIRTLSDRVIVLDSGELLAEGKPEEVLRKKEVREAYLGE